MTLRGAFVLIGVAVTALAFALPLAGWPPVVRLPALLVPAITAGLLLARPWRWEDGEWQRLVDWQPSSRSIAAAAAAVGLLVFWIVLTRFKSGAINAVDFTVYFDRPCYQTVQGRPLLIETADLASLSWRSLLAVHAFWALVPLCGLYWVHATPLWLLALSVVAVIAGAVHVLRIVRLIGGSGPLAAAAALAFVFNDNTARTLNYGFHPEVLYAWFVPWLLEAGLRRSHGAFAAAAAACILVKEDACMPLFASAVALFLGAGRSFSPRDQLYFLVAPTALALANLALFYTWAVPALVPDGRPTYSSYWVNYGPTPARALAGMVTQPLRVISDALTSGLFGTVLPPHAWLPLIGWRWVLGIAPIVVLYGASGNEQLRAFGIYYSIVLVPFLVVGSAAGVMSIVGWFRMRPQGHALTAAALALAALVAGSTRAGYSLRPWRPEVAAVPAALERLAREPAILVQSGLYPHAGYDARVQLLAPHALRDPRYRDAAVLLAPAIGRYPFSAEQLTMMAGWPAVTGMPHGLRAVRVTRSAIVP